MTSTIVIEGCAIATVDDERREIADGHLVIEDGGITAVGEGRRRRRAASARRARIDGGRPARHARPDQLPPPPLPVGHARLRAGGDAVRVARRALPGLAAHRRRRGRRGGARGPRVAGAVGLHDVDRPPLHLPPPRRRPARRRDRRRARDRPALPPLPRRDGPRRRAPAACRPTTSSRTATRSSPRAPRRSTATTTRRRARCVRIALAPTSPFSVTGELMAETAELARARGVRLHTHLAETDDEEGFCLERFGVRPLRVPRRPRLARRRRLARALRAPRRGRGAADGRDGHRRRALPDVQRPARRRASRRCPALLAAGAPVGLGVDGAASNECGELVDELRAALVLARAARGPARADRAPGAGDGHAPRRALPGPRRRARPPERRRAGRRRAVGPRRGRLRRHRRPRRRARLRPDAPGRHAARRRRGRRRRTASCAPPIRVDARGRPAARERADGARRRLRDDAPQQGDVWRAQHPRAVPHTGAGGEHDVLLDEAAERQRRRGHVGARLTRSDGPAKVAGGSPTPRTCASRACSSARRCAARTRRR